MLDWYEFDVNGEVNLGTTAGEAGEQLVRTVMPAPVTAPGLPARRFWELEDAAVNLSALEPAETDLAQVLLIETLSGYGNDWFVIGVDLPVGRLVRTTSLVVGDTFGVRSLLRPVGTGSAQVPGWSMFQQAMPYDADAPEGAAIRNLLYLAPRLARPVVGGVVEEVLLARDEQANLGWAIERVVESPLQAPVPLNRTRPRTRLATPTWPLTITWPRRHRRTGFRCCRCAAAPMSRSCWPAARCSTWTIAGWCTASPNCSVAARTAPC